MKSSSKKIALLTMYIMLGGLIAGAAAAPATRPPAQDTYVLGPGDSIDVLVFGEPDLTRTVTIKPDGTIALPLLNEVKAAGKTTEQLQAELSKLYSKYLKAPSIAVAVHEFRIDRIYLLGQVKAPGEIQLRPNVGILELLATAGGPTVRADLAKAVIIRDKTETIKLDLFDAIAKNRDPDVKLRAGDVVFIPETDRRIAALGEVKNPGAFELLEGQHVTELLAAAGGPTPKAGLSKAFIMRDNAQIPVDLKRVLNGDMGANAPLKAGDMLVIPENKDKIAVLGAVNKPGPIDLTENMTLLQALAEAGGPAEKANLSALQVVRFEGGKPKQFKIDAQKAIEGKADGSNNMILQPGDLVYIPPKGPGILDILGIFGVVRGAFGF